MTHMKPEIIRTRMIDVDTDAGHVLVPADVFNPLKPLEFTEGAKLYGTDKVSGWFARLSAPGFVDCTDWRGPFYSRWEAKAEILRSYGVCPDCGVGLDDERPVCANCEADYGELTDRSDYRGDGDYCHGGVWFDLNGDWEHGYVKALEICPIPEHSEAFWLSHYATTTPESETVEEALEDKRVRDALRYCGMSPEDLKASDDWRLMIASMLFDFGCKDPETFTRTLVIATTDDAVRELREAGIEVDHRIPEGRALDVFLADRIDWLPAASS